MSAKLVEEGKSRGLNDASIIATVTALTAASIADALAQLEQEATTNGFAIGTGAGLEVTIDTVAEWARELQERGILLIPVSATYKGRMS